MKKLFKNPFAGLLTLAIVLTVGLAFATPDEPEEVKEEVATCKGTAAMADRKKPAMTISIIRVFILLILLFHFAGYHFSV